MTYDQNPSSQSRRRRRFPVVLTSLTAFMLSHQITPSECFSVAQQQQPSAARQSVQYHAQSTIPLRFTTDSSLPDVLPPLTAAVTVHSGLSNAMRRSHFTSDEIRRLTNCIQEATAGDEQLQQRTFEFCEMLTTTTELGLPGLMAGAYQFAGRTPTDSSAQAIWSSAERLRLLEQKTAAVAPGDYAAIRHLMLTEMDDWRALAIRLVVCLFTLDRESAKAALSVYAPLASRLGLYRVKNELENTAFRMRYPRQYAAVHALRPAANDMETVLSQMRTEMTEMLQNDPEFSSQVESFEVSARVKEPYSMWRKMLKMNYASFRQVPDALALRIVLQAAPSDEHEEVTRGRERALCYYAQQLCLERWNAVPNDPRFKDYIGNPKRNGYQSLHYTAAIRNDWTCEIQVRSAEMHRTAEFGPASHCEYKERSIVSDQDSYWQHRYPRSRRASIEQHPFPCDERSGNLRPYLEALAQTKSEYTHSSVVVFLKPTVGDKPELLRLPAGACVWDAVRSYTSVKQSSATLNGEAEIPVTRQLHNGDVLELSI